MTAGNLRIALTCFCCPCLPPSPSHSLHLLRILHLLSYNPWVNGFPSSLTNTMWSHHQTVGKTDDNSRSNTCPQGQKLRSACDRCHHAKLKCSGGKPCAGCYDSREQCCYSVSHKPGRPKGVKNKRNFDQTGTRKTKTARSGSRTSTKSLQNQHRQHSSSVPSMMPNQDDAMPDFNNTQLDGPLTTDMLQDMSASLTSSGYSELLDLETSDELRKHSMVKASIEEQMSRTQG